MILDKYQQQNGNTCRNEDDGTLQNTTAKQGSSALVTKLYDNKSLKLNSDDMSESEAMTDENWLSNNVDNPKRAVIELSTKAVKWLIPKVDNQTIWTFNFNHFIQNSEKTETGNGINRDNIMNLDYFRKKVLPSIKMAKKQIIDNKVDVVHCIATAAYRSAKNRTEILDIIKAETGLSVCILSKRLEAEYTLWGYLYSASDNRLKEARNVLLIDQGGGSTEVTFFQNQEIRFNHSFNMGTTVLKNNFFQSSEVDISKRLAYVDSKHILTFREEIQNIANFSTPKNNKDVLCICVGTAITAAKGNGGLPNKQVHDKKMTKSQIQHSIDIRTQELSSIPIQKLSDVAQRISRNGQFDHDQWLDKRLTSRLGLPIMLEIMEKFDATELRINGVGLWYGVFYQKLVAIE